MDKAAVLELKNVSKKIGKRKIIDSLSISVQAGEVFGLLGPNGAGKTTSIRMMVGLMKLSEGEIQICGKNVQTQFEEAMLNVGAIVENPEMYKYMTGYDNLVHYARMLPNITKQRIDEAIELVGLGARIHDKVKTYSLGMRQRLGVAQALLHKPKLLILDEPTNGLDPAGIRELRDYLRQLAKEEHIAVIVSSHLLSEMELMCDRVAIIQNGKLLDTKQLKNTELDDIDPQLKTYWISFEVDNIEQAKTVWQGLQQENVIEPMLGKAEQSIKLLITRAQIAEYNRLLVSAGVSVFRIYEEQVSLEDQFLEITGGEGIV